MCVMIFGSHQEIDSILIGMSLIQQVCFFDIYLCVLVHSMTSKLRYLRNASVTKTLRPV